MELKLKSALTSRTLKSACRILILISLVFAFEYSRGFVYALLFLFALAFFYFKPNIGSGKLLVPIAIALAEMFFLPKGLGAETYIYFSIFIGAVLSAIIALKNLRFIRRALAYFLINFSLASCAALFYIYMGFSSPLVYGFALFVVLFILFRDFYTNGANFELRRADLVSVFFALVLVEIIWAIAVSPLVLSLKTAAAILSIFTLNYLYIRESKELTHLLGGASLT